jgi:hypothetical protein
VRLVNAATYPEVLLTKGAQRSTARYVAVVERLDFADSVDADFSFYRSSRWRPIVRCPLPQSFVVVVESTRLPARPSAAADLAARLGQATSGRVPCRPV